MDDREARRLRVFFRMYSLCEENFPGGDRMEVTKDACAWWRDVFNECHVQ